MGSRSIINDHNSILKEIDGNQLSSGRVFLRNSKVFDGLGLDLRWPRNILPKVNVNGIPPCCKEGGITSRCEVRRSWDNMSNGTLPTVCVRVSKDAAEERQF